MREGLVLLLVNSIFLMFEGVKIHALLLRMGDLAKVIPVMPQASLGIQLLMFMLKAKKLCQRKPRNVWFFCLFVFKVFMYLS